MDRLPEREQQLASRWHFLEQAGDACAVVTRRMEVLYLNAAARVLVPSEWFGRRCWEVFPVAEEGCAARCPAIRAVSNAEDIAYCEETLVAPDGITQNLGVAVIPLRIAGAEGEQAILLLRPKAPGEPEDILRRELLRRAAVLRGLCG